MDELTTGAFARATGLTRKALRLYDDLDLLRPVRTDPVTGYRYYAAAQLSVARRVAWLRRVGMPLARIRACSDLSRAELAVVVRDWWAQEEAAGVERRALVAALVEALEEDDMPESDGRATLRLRCGAASAQGPVRDRQQDSAGGDER
ncbi:MerR family transcriptional regulator [Pseudonocardia sp. ICBG601]|uniref:MerR family transcriptional regulator n=1 Tax=Pseudonocardia sp. ICBG601 TaxID=2846759 RepID=UPI001CF66C30|nr:MerR family transcriptional regulator [Pseudonocardia sp. ICBG601]